MLTEKQKSPARPRQLRKSGTIAENRLWCRHVVAVLMAAANQYQIPALQIWKRAKDRLPDLGRDARAAAHFVQRMRPPPLEIGMTKRCQTVSCSLWAGFCQR
jgi:hypothetical protein